MIKDYTYSRGIFNDYNSQKGPVEVLLSDLRHIYLSLRNLFQHKGKPKRVLCYPYYPGKSSTLFKILDQMGYVVTNRPTGTYDLILNWDLNTYRKVDEKLIDLSKSQRVWNMACIDISKDRVEEVFKDIFGYGTQVDPQQFTGKLVVKPKLNAVEEGKILQGPIKTVDPAYFYQRHIQTSDGNGDVVDIRVPVIGARCVPFVYKKYRADTDETKNPIRRSEFHDIGAVFTAIEIEQINHFIAAMGLDFGELDVLRDNHNGKIFIIDVNPTPTGPSGMTKSGKTRALNELAKALQAELP